MLKCITHVLNDCCAGQVYYQRCGNLSGSSVSGCGLEIGGASSIPVEPRSDKGRSDKGRLDAAFILENPNPDSWIQKQDFSFLIINPKMDIESKKIHTPGRFRRSNLNPKNLIAIHVKIGMFKKRRGSPLVCSCFVLETINRNGVQGRGRILKCSVTFIPWFLKRKKQISFLQRSL